MKKKRGQTISAEEIESAMKRINRSKRSAMNFLKRIGVKVMKSGEVTVRPI